MNCDLTLVQILKIIKANDQTHVNILTRVSNHRPSFLLKVHSYIYVQCTITTLVCWTACVEREFLVEEG